MESERRGMYYVSRSCLHVRMDVCGGGAVGLVYCRFFVLVGG